MNTRFVRQVVLDTETTGMNKFGLHYDNHKIIEIGAVEIIDRCLTNRKFHVYLNPHRSVDPEAFKVHGISDQFLINQPIFSDIANELLIFIRDSELIIHNAPFDLGFLNNELKNVDLCAKKIESYCTVIDSLKIARKMFPGQRNSLDALCERYDIDNNKRILHNALIDAQLLAYVFLLMTSGGQTKIKFKDTIDTYTSCIKENNTVLADQTKTNINIQKSLSIIYADELEQLEHNKYLDLMEKFSKSCLWKQLNKKNVFK